VTAKLHKLEKLVESNALLVETDNLFCDAYQDNEFDLVQYNSPSFATAQ
jgi:hypothetical protein